MPLQVKLKCWNQGEQTIEFPDDATVLTVKEWVHKRFFEPVERLIVHQEKYLSALSDEVLLSSDPKFLNLTVERRRGGG
jgi:hypothetical protein